MMPPETFYASAVPIPIPIPNDFPPEPELTGDPPRPIPRLLDKGWHGRKKAAEVWGWLTVSALCIAGAHTPVLQQDGLFILPFQHLDWIGYCFVAKASWCAFRRRSQEAVYQYVRRGVPVPVRIVDLTFDSTRQFDGVHSNWVYTAVVEFDHPETGQQQQWVLRSPV
ncbi:MAG: hypothetical protein ACRDD1_13180, partial [Planctomycetia bacterium]